MAEKNEKIETAILSKLDKLEKVGFWFFGGALALFLFVYGTLPIYDPDFWWHLKTGKVMVESGGLLQSDPFNFTGDGVVSVRESLILKGYWLWQVVAYGLFRALGLNGNFLLNLITVGTMVGVVIRQLLRQRVGYALSACLMTSALYLTRNIYPLERPQVVSFLFAIILLGFISRVREGGKLGWTLPLLMMVWANLHGGFVVGDIILLCFAAGVVIEYRRDLPRLRYLLFWVALGIGASLLNPNGALVFGDLFSFHNSKLMTGVSEYQSTLVKFQQGYRFIAILWVLIGLYGVGVWISRCLFWPEFIVALFLAYFSAAYLRNVGFFAVAMLPAIGFHLHQGARRRQWQFPRPITFLLLALCTTFILWNAYTLWQGRNDSGPIRTICSEKAISFLQNSGLKGRMFNDYTYGSYLLWRLSPQTKIFIDGRGLEPGVFEDWQKISEGSTAWVDGRREYDALLDSYAIDYVVQPLYDGAGRVQPLMKILLNRSEWVPVYLDPTVYILARHTAVNAKTIAAYQIDKSVFKAMVYDYLCQSSPQSGNSLMARAGMLLYLGRYEEAKTFIAALATIAPNHQALPALQNELAYVWQQRLRQ